MPKGGSTDFPQLIFSARAIPKWNITLSDSASVFEILRLESDAHYVEITASTQLASLLSFQSLGHPGLFLLVFGAVCLSSIPSIVDLSCLESPLPLKSVSQLGLGLSSFGTICFELSLSILDLLHLDLASLLQSSAHLAFVVFAFDFQKAGLSLALRAAAKLDFSPFSSGCSWPDLLLPVANLAQLGTSLLIRSSS